jgi:hypothetical protein
MQDDVELIAFIKEFGCDAIYRTFLRIRFSLRDRFCRLGAKRHRRTRFSPAIRAGGKAEETVSPFL